jgi:O-antigen biosynthesis protein
MTSPLLRLRTRTDSRAAGAPRRGTAPLNRRGSARATTVPHANPAPWFDEAWYTWYYPDVPAAVATGRYPSALDHFLREGELQERSPNPCFDAVWYRERHADVAAAIAGGELASPWEHYLLHGRRERRSSTPYFDSEAYLDACPDVRRAVERGEFFDAVAHFLERGLAEGRAATIAFDPERYLALNPSAAAAMRSGELGHPLEHLLRRGAVELVRLEQPLQASAEPLRESLCCQARLELTRFLSGDTRLSLPVTDVPILSVLVVAHNNAELTYECLSALAAQLDVPAEVLLLDNASQDRTAELLRRIDGLQWERSADNVGFVAGTNQLAARARGSVLLLLNNDAFLRTGVAAAVERLLEDDRLGAVGGKLIAPDGRLQEMGCGMTTGGTSYGFGRGDLPFRGVYSSERECPYVSGALLLTRRECFLAAGGLDTLFHPGYFEDTDYCFRLAAKGSRTVASPALCATHVEGATFSRTASSRALFERNRALFRSRHADALTTQSIWVRDCTSVPVPLLPGRSGTIYVDDHAPLAGLGSGLPRAVAIVDAIVGAGRRVTCVGTVGHDLMDLGCAATDLPREVEFVALRRGLDLEQVFEQRRGGYDTVWASRPHNMKRLRLLKQRRPDLFAGVRVIYDAEAIFALRELSRGDLDEAERAEWTLELQRELREADAADIVVAVSAAEAAVLGARGKAPVVIAHRVTPRSLPAPDLLSREGLLFVGAVHSRTSPNYASLAWFLEAILPCLQRRLPGIDLRVAGYWSPEVPPLEVGTGAVTQLGYVRDLAPLYDRARIFVAPMLYGAGVPLKVIEAAAHGIPVCASPLVQSQLGWRPGHELHVADPSQPERFADAIARLYDGEPLWRRIQDGAHARVSQEHSPEALLRAVAGLVGDQPDLSARPPLAMP